MGVERAVLADGDTVLKYIVLLAGADAGTPIRGRTRLQKMMFMASKSDDRLDWECSFGLDNYGPYSDVVNGELEYLVNIGVLRVINDGISITGAGRRIAGKMSKACSADACLMIRNVKRFLNDMTPRELLGYIYAAYPETASESAEYERIKPQIESIMVALIRKEKITSGHAAGILGKPRHYVIELMKEAGIAYLH